MRFCLLASFVGLATILAFPQLATANDSIVTVEPSCPAWQTPTAAGQPMIPPTITIRYDPRSQSARLKSSQAISLILATSTFYRYDSSTIPMLRSDDGTWQATYTPKKNNITGYSIFFFRDADGRIDNHGSQYWDILNCDSFGAAPGVSPWTVEAQASTYEGGLLAPGIQRSPDLGRAIQIVAADLEARPAAVTHYPFLWRLELEQGRNSPAAFNELDEQVNAFLDAHGTDLLAMRQAVSFVAAQQQRLSPGVVARFRAALTAFPEKADPIQMNAQTKEVIHIPRTAHFVAGAQQEAMRGLADFDYSAIDINDQDQQRNAAAYLAFAEKYPESSRTTSAYQMALHYEAAIPDIPGAEAVFEKWSAAFPSSPIPSLEMAQVYINHKSKPARAVELLDAAEKLYLESERPSSHQHFRREPGKLESLRGQAHLLLKDASAARADFEAAVKAAPDNPDFAYALGQTCEQTGDDTRALEAYLAAASAPYQENAAPGDAYKRLFVALRLGSEQDAEQKLASQVTARIRRATTEYTPLAMNRPAPAFAFTDFAGKHFDNETTKGKPAVITFWGVWCPPCVAELPAIEEFQTHHPDANVLAVEIGDKPDKVKAFLAAHNLNKLHVATQVDWPEEFGALGAPASIVIDRFGQIQFVHVGLLPDVDAILGKDLSTFPEPN